MLKVGIMQGRLSPRPYPKIQSFPWNSWENEFKLASEVGLYSIEWIFEKNRFEENPVWTKEGRTEIDRIIKRTGTKIRSLCADYFLENYIYQYTVAERKKQTNIMIELIKKASDIGVRTILFPVLEEAELKNDDDKKTLCEFLNDCDDTLKANNIIIGIEAELEAKRYLQLIQEIHNSNVKVYYDAGNCAAKGYDTKSDLELLYDSLISVHIKDRKRNGPSVFLGQGDTDIRGGILALLERCFEGQIILQTYFEDDYYQTTKQNVAYISGIVKQYMEDKSN